MIPNLLPEVEACKRENPVAWANAHTGNAQSDDFIKLLAARCHAIDSRFGNNGKRGNALDLSDDALCFKGEGADFDPTDGNAPRTVIDVIGAAGSPAAVPTWVIVTNPDKPVGAAWVKPNAAPAPEPPPHVCPTLTVPSYAQLGDDAFFRAMIGVPLFADYAMAGQPPNDGMSVWFSRATYRLLAAFIKAQGQPVDAVAEVKIVRNEWRAGLGLPALR